MNQNELLRFVRFEIKSKWIRIKNKMIRPLESKIKKKDIDSPHKSKSFCDFLIHFGESKIRESKWIDLVRALLTAVRPQPTQFTIIYVISSWPRVVLILMEIWNINVNSINFSFCNRICSLVGANLFPFIRLKTWVIFGLKFSFLLSGSGQSKNRFGFKRFREIERHEKNDKIRKRRQKGSLSAPIGTVLVRHFLLNRLNFLQ